MIITAPPGTGTSSGSEPAADDRSSAASTDIDRPGVHRAPNRLLWLVAVALIGLALVGLAVWYLTSSIRVELSVDGRSQSIDTRADSVADLLVGQGIVVTGDDLVTPPPDTDLADGDAVVVRYARPLSVVVDGVETMHTTTERTVGEALRAVGAPVDGAAVSVPLTEALPPAGASVEITTPKPLDLVVGGELLEVTSAAETVGEVLEAEGIVLSGTDTVVPPIDTVVTTGMTIAVTRIRVDDEIRTESLAHDVVERDDPDLTVGTREIVTEGVDGEQEVTYSVTYTDGEITSEQVLSSTVTREPVTEVVAVGSKPAVVQSVDPGGSAGAASSGLNWAALAQCESSGNPKAVNPAGYYGLYQFSPAPWASVGGTGNPADASPAEQTNRAQILYDRSGVGQWPHCGPRLFD